jgi:hypothetical protein
MAHVPPPTRLPGAPIGRIRLRLSAPPSVGGT